MTIVDSLRTVKYKGLSDVHLAIDTDGKRWFQGSSILQCLGYSSPSVSYHTGKIVSGEFTRFHGIKSAGHTPAMYWDEEGVLEVLGRCQRPGVAAFRAWFIEEFRVPKKPERQAFPKLPEAASSKPDLYEGVHDVFQPIKDAFNELDRLREENVELRRQLNSIRSLVQFAA